MGPKCRMHGRSPRIEVPTPLPPKNVSSTAPSFRFVVLFVSAFLVLSANGSMFVLVVGLKQIALDFGWPRSVPSLAYSCLFLGTGIGGIVMGYWFDRSGPGPVTGLGMTMIGTGALLASMVEAQWQLYAIYGVMMGLLGQAAVIGPLVVNVMRWFEHRRGFAVGLLAAGQGVAGTIWPPVFRYINEEAGWRTTYLWFGIFVLLTALPLTALLWRRLPSRPVNPKERERVSAPSGTRVRRLGLSDSTLQTVLCLAMLACCVPMSIPLGHLIAHASDLGHPNVRAAEMLAVALFAATLVRLAGGALIVDRFGALSALLVFSGIQAAALVLYAMVGSLLALYSVSMLFGVGYGGIAMCYPVIIREQLPAAESGRRLGLVLLFGAIGMALGGGIGGYLFDATGSYTPAFLAGAAFNALNLVIVCSLVFRRRRMGAPPLAVAS